MTVLSSIFLYIFPIIRFFSLITWFFWAVNCPFHYIVIHAWAKKSSIGGVLFYIMLCVIIECGYAWILRELVKGCISG